MAITDRQGRIVRLLWRRARIGALLILVIFAGSAVWNIWAKEQDSRVMRDRAQQELSDLQTQESRLHADIGSLQTERGKEEALRQQYEVGKPGEKLIIIVEPDKPQVVEATSSFSVWVHKFLPFW